MQAKIDEKGLKEDKITKALSRLKFEFPPPPIDYYQNQEKREYRDWTMVEGEACRYLWYRGETIDGKPDGKGVQVYRSDYNNGTDADKNSTVRRVDDIKELCNMYVLYISI